MPASLDTRLAHLVRNHGDITAIYTWVNDERALVLVPNKRPGAPWYVVMESAAYTWDDSEPSNVPQVARKAAKACEVLGMEPTSRNVLRMAQLIIEGIPDLVRIPTRPDPEKLKGSFGRMELRGNGELLTEQDITVEKEQGATYA